MPASVRQPSFCCIVVKVNFEELDKGWVIQHRLKGVSVSGPVLPEKALQLFKILYPE